MHQIISFVATKKDEIALEADEIVITTFPNELCIIIRKNSLKSDDYTVISLIEQNVDKIVDNHNNKIFGKEKVNKIKKHIVKIYFMTQKRKDLLWEIKVMIHIISIHMFF